MNPLVRALVLTACACLTIALTACNTTKGVGQDIESGGENLSHSAQQHGARP